MADAAPAAAADAAFRPSDYTAALLGRLRARADLVRGARVLEVGCGSGVLLAAAGALGAGALCGVDIEPDAVAAACRLLAAGGLAERSEILCGDLFVPVAGRRFDLVLANLPHFPMAAAAAVDDRRPSWSTGGPDGRALVDAFVAGLPAHLAAGGRALMVHNAFVDLDATRAAAARGGLDVDVVDRVVVPIPPVKLAAMTPAVLAREAGRTIHRFGPHAFGEMLVLELAAA